MRATPLLLVLAACEATPPTGLLPALAPPPPPEPPRDALDEAIDAAKAEGLDVPAPPPPAPPAPAPSPVTPEALVTEPPRAPVPLVLVGVVADATPPRGVLALPDGTEIVVRAGAWIGPAHAVVLGIDASGVDLARVVADGARATVQPERLATSPPPAP